MSRRSNTKETTNYIKENCPGLRFEGSPYPHFCLDLGESSHKIRILGQHRNNRKKRNSPQISLIFRIEYGRWVDGKGSEFVVGMGNRDVLFYGQTEIMKPRILSRVSEVKMINSYSANRKRRIESHLRVGPNSLIGRGGIMSYLKAEDSHLFKTKLAEMLE
jgi:hypothetical protein